MPCCATRGQLIRFDSIDRGAANAKVKSAPFDHSNQKAIALQEGLKNK